jgi:hypothetical protein
VLESLVKEGTAAESVYLDMESDILELDSAGPADLDAQRVEI